MSLTRQTALLIVGVLWLAILASLGVHAIGTQDALRLQQQIRNRDDATLLALALSQQGGDDVLMQAVASATFDLGHYQRLSLRSVDGQVLFDLGGPDRQANAPRWLVEAMPIQAPPGHAQVSDGWKAVGQLEVSAHSAWAHEAMWSTLQWTAWLLLALGLAAGLATNAVLRAWKRPLEVTMAQAQAIEEGRFVIADEPKAIELKRLTRSMNSMVLRLRQWFDSQAAQVDALQRAAQTDAVSGLSNRRHFIGQLEADRHAPPGRIESIVIVRVQELATLNQRAGRNAADQALRTVGVLMMEYPRKVDGAFAGRLNGSDFALALPSAGLAEEVARALMMALRAGLESTVGAAQLVIGAVDHAGALPLPDLLAAADAALAQAEAEGSFSVQTQDGPGRVRGGEQAWRQRIEACLDGGRLQLAKHPVLDASGSRLHWSCPLRLQLDPAGEFLTARDWLPLAARAQLLPQVDLHAIVLALDAIALDGQARAVHMAARSLAEVGFIDQVLATLRDRPKQAASLIVEVTEPASESLVRALREATRAWRPLGVRIAIEDLGGMLQGRDWLQSLPLHHVRIGHRALAGLVVDAAVVQYARGLAALVHGLGLKVIAGDVDDPAELGTIWDVGFDGAIGDALRAPQGD